MLDNKDKTDEKPSDDPAAAWTIMGKPDEKTAEPPTTSVRDLADQWFHNAQRVSKINITTKKLLTPDDSFPSTTTSTGRRDRMPEQPNY